MKTTIIRLFTTSTLLLGCCCFLSADSFDDYLNRKNKEFEDAVGAMTNRFDSARNVYNTRFEKKRAEYNQRFIEYLGRPWQSYKMEQNKPSPLPSPDPVDLVPADDTKPIEVIKPKEKFELIELPNDEDIDLTIRDIPQTASHVFDYYGAQLKVELTKSEALQFKVGGSNEKQVAQAMKYLTSSKKFMTLVDNCVSLRERYNMCDWGYVMLTDKLAKSYYGESNRNESVMLRAFILTQTGYDIRIGRSSAGLELMVYSEDDIKARLYISLNGKNFYVITFDINSNDNIRTYKESYSDESQSCSMKIRSPQIFAENPANTRNIKSRLGLNTVTAVNKNLMDFYNDYPHCEWLVYAISGMSNELSEQVVESLRRQLTGLGKKESVERILNYVQTGFPYAKDSVQFNGERSLFPDESLYYPGSDCEDHAILFAYLVHRLVGLDVIFLYYSQKGYEHLSTAVNFKDNSVIGDYILYEGARYVMCDPTIGGYGARIGVQAAGYKYLEPKCYKIVYP